MILPNHMFSSKGTNFKIIYTYTYKHEHKRVFKTFKWKNYNLCFYITYA